MEHFNPILGNETTGQKFITCGEIMLRLTPPNYEKIRMASAFEASYGGSEANIALALANLGVDSTFFSVVPNNSLGKSAVRWLRSNDVHCTPMILTEPDETPSNRLGTYYLETGYGIRPSKVIYDRDNTAIAAVKPGDFDWDAILADADWFHVTGITPALSESLCEATIEALKKCKCIAYAETKEELQEMAYGPTHTSRYDVVYPIEGLGTVKEAEVVRCKNGCVVNFMEDYMRRRDPNSMAIGDELPTDKPRFKDRFGYEFSKLRQETLDWLSNQQIVMLPFYAGPNGHGYPSLMICPLNAAFFALSLANMQGFTSIVDVPEHYKPRAIIFVAPPFRHTHFDGKQVVVHNRSETLHEVFAYNLYPGPSDKNCYKVEKGGKHHGLRGFENARRDNGCNGVRRIMKPVHEVENQRHCHQQNDHPQGSLYGFHDQESLCWSIRSFRGRCPR